MKQTETPISERVRGLEGADPQLVREVQMMERTASGQIVHGAANGRSPRHWSLERWVLVGGFAGTLLYQVFGLGVTFSDIQRGVSTAVSAIQDVRVDLAEHIRVHTREHEELRARVPASSPGSAERRRVRTDDDKPAFPRDERFTGGEQ